MNEVIINSTGVGIIVDQSFHDIATAISVLGERQALKYINKAMKNEIVHREKLRLLKEAKSGKAGKYLLTHYKKLTSDEERQAFCKALNIKPSLMEEACTTSK